MIREPFTGIKTAQEAQERQGSQRVYHKHFQVWGALRVFPGGDQVDGLPPAPSYRRWVVLPAAYSIIKWARAVFGVDVLRLSLSDPARALHASIDMYELAFCPSGMSGYALSMEHDLLQSKVL